MNEASRALFEAEGAGGRVDDAATLVELVGRQARRLGERRLLLFLGEEGFDGPELSARGLDRRARAIAVDLARRGLCPGDRAILLFPPGLDFVTAFFGCLYAGVVAVPVYPPARPLELTLPRLLGIAERSRPAALLSDRDTLALVAPLLSGRGWPSGMGA
jgi:acyl-CoA synthetase (AMP-forming)/AMP-acid ligase II